MAIKSRRVQLTSQALSASTFLFLSLIASISDSTFIVTQLPYLFCPTRSFCYRLKVWCCADEYCLSIHYFCSFGKDDNASLGISFEYPKSFIFNSPKIDNGTIYLSITTPEVSAEEAASPGFDYSAYDSEAMRVSISKFTNTENLSLYDFIAKQHKTYPGNGITDTFDTYKKYLTSTGIPRPGSYMFNGNVSENPVKTVYFEHNGSVYAFNLGGGRGTGQSYSADADKLFNKILQSIKFK